MFTFNSIIGYILLLKFSFSSWEEVWINPSRIYIQSKIWI